MSNLHPASLHKPVPLTPLPSFLTSLTTHLHFRQSLINDYLLCPQMSLYRWLLQTSSQPSFFSALLGTAGHAVISEVHATNSFSLSADTLSKLFRHACKAELAKIVESSTSANPTQLPQISVRFQTHEEQIHRLSPEYVQLLSEYFADKRNQSFHPVINESSFVLELPGNILELSQDRPAFVPAPPFLFTGLIDQGGYYDNGDFAIRDIKFREMAFKPDGFKLNFNKQLTLYTTGVRYGVPSCGVCKPTAYQPDEYLLDDFAFEKPSSPQSPGAAKESSRTGTPASRSESGISPVTYNGPCATCRAKIGTNLWPNILPARSELIWMRDYKVYQKDQHTKFIKHPTEKAINPKTGRHVKKDIVNPKYLEGYKAGSHRGPAILSTSRNPDQLAAFMAEMRLICQSIRDGIFYRREGDHCVSWCRYRDACLGRVELQMGPSLTQLNEGAATGSGDGKTDDFTADFFS